MVSKTQKTLISNEVVRTCLPCGLTLKILRVTSSPSRGVLAPGLDHVTSNPVPHWMLPRVKSQHALTNQSITEVDITSPSWQPMVQV
jgi:hypothetical protein